MPKISTLTLTSFPHPTRVNATVWQGELGRTVTGLDSPGPRVMRVGLTKDGDINLVVSSLIGPPFSPNKKSLLGDDELALKLFPDLAVPRRTEEAWGIVYIDVDNTGNVSLRGVTGLLKDCAGVVDWAGALSKKGGVITPFPAQEKVNIITTKRVTECEIIH
jgi:hypothetical protein